jgi:hypothetical protein
MSVIGGTHPGYLLIVKVKDGPDEVYQIDDKKRIKLDFAPIESDPDPTHSEAVIVTGFIAHVPGLTGNMVAFDSTILHRILHYSLQHSITNLTSTFKTFWRAACAAAGLEGTAHAIVMCGDGQVRKLMVHTDGGYVLEEFEETTLYQQGRVLTKRDFMTQLTTIHYKHVATIENLFDPTQVDGFIMPNIN